MCLRLAGPGPVDGVADCAMVVSIWDKAPPQNLEQLPSWSFGSTSSGSARALVKIASPLAR
eukprot:2110988-Pyramimonas_sp.AAC.1